MSSVSRTFEFFWKSLQKEEEIHFSYLLAAGPIFVFCTTIVGLQRHANFDLILLAIFGVIFCLKSSMRGWIYSASLLLIGAMIKHAFFTSFHLWQFGIEGSMLLGFALTAYASHILLSKEKKVFLQIESKEQTIRNLEEELSIARESSLNDQISFHEKISTLQKDLDENFSEVKSLKVLNDVLRKTSAQTLVEREEMAQKCLDQETENRSIANDFQQFKRQSQEQLSAKEEQNQTLSKRLEEIQENVIQNQKFREQLLSDFETKYLSLQEMNQNLQLECQALQEKYAKDELKRTAVQEELQNKNQQITQFEQTIHGFQDRLKKADQKESIYLELKKQFEEKNRVLHQTRSELFSIDTALQSYLIDQDLQKTGEPTLEEHRLCSELIALEEENQTLDQENQILSQLVDILSHAPAKTPRRSNKYIQTTIFDGEEEPKPKRTRAKKII